MAAPIEPPDPTWLNTVDYRGLSDLEAWEWGMLFVEMELFEEDQQRDPERAYRAWFRSRAAGTFYRSNLDVIAKLHGSLRELPLDQIPNVEAGEVVLAVDLRDPPAALEKEFSRWLRSQKPVSLPKYQGKEPSREFTANHLKIWRDRQIVKRWDIGFWALCHGHELKYKDIGVLMFGDHCFNPEERERTARRTLDEARSLVRSLLAQGRSEAT